MLRRKKAEPPATRNPSQQASKAPVFSYYSNRHNSSDYRGARSESDTLVRTKGRKSPWWLGYLPSIIALGVVSASALYVTTLATNPRIDITDAQGRLVVLQETKVYEQAAEALLKQSVLNRSKLFINTDEVARKLRSEFPELGETVVTIPLIGRKPIIKVRPATPAMLIASSGETYVIGEDGTAILKSSQLVSSIRDRLPIVTDFSGTDIRLGKQIVTTDLVMFMGQIEKHLSAKKITVGAYTLPTVANELHFQPAGEGYIVKLNTEIDARQQIGTYLAVRDKLLAENTLPAEYIDVRIEERAYYK